MVVWELLQGASLLFCVTIAFWTLVNERRRPFDAVKYPPCNILPLRQHWGLQPSIGHANKRPTLDHYRASSLSVQHHCRRAANSPSSLYSRPHATMLRCPSPSNSTTIHERRAFIMDAMFKSKIMEEEGHARAIYVHTSPGL